MPLADYIPENIMTRGGIKQLAALSDYLRQGEPIVSGEEPMGYGKPTVESVEGYQLTPDEEDQYRHTPPKKVVELTPEERQAFDAARQKPAEQPVAQPTAEPAEQPVQKPVAKKPQAAPENEILKEYNRLLKESPGEAKQFRFDKEQEAKKANLMKIYDASNQIGAAYGEDAAKRFIETNKAKLDLLFDAQDPTKTPEFEVAKTVGTSNQYRQFGQVVSNLKNILESAQNQLNNKVDKDEVSNFLSVNVPKILLSVATPGSSEALQIEEAYRTMPELFNYLGLGLNPNAWFKTMSSRGFWSSFTKDPQSFIKKSTEMHSSVARTHNQLTDRYVKTIGTKAADNAGLFYVDEYGGNKGNLSEIRSRLNAIQGNRPAMRNSFIMPSQQQQQPQSTIVPAKSSAGVVNSVNVGSVWPSLMQSQD